MGLSGHGSRCVLLVLTLRVGTQVPTLRVVDQSLVSVCPATQSFAAVRSHAERGNEGADC
jgi:hypothetical protein